MAHPLHLLEEKKKNVALPLTNHKEHINNFWIEITGLGKKHFGFDSRVYKLQSVTQDNV